MKSLTKEQENNMKKETSYVDKNNSRSFLQSRSKEIPAADQASRVYTSKVHAFNSLL